MTYCCEALRQLVEEWDGPFKIPLYITTDHSLKANKVAVGLFNLTPAGNISRKGASAFFIRYCPVCGQRLIDEEADDDQD